MSFGVKDAIEGSWMLKNNNFWLGFTVVIVALCLISCIFALILGMKIWEIGAILAGIWLICSPKRGRRDCCDCSCEYL